MTTAIASDHFDFAKWYAEQDAIAQAHARKVGAAEANEKYGSQDYVDSLMKQYKDAKAYAASMTERTGKAWIASAHGGVQPAQDMLGDKVSEYLK